MTLTYRYSHTMRDLMCWKRWQRIWSTRSI